MCRDLRHAPCPGERAQAPAVAERGDVDALRRAVDHEIARERDPDVRDRTLGRARAEPRAAEEEQLRRAEVLERDAVGASYLAGHLRCRTPADQPPGRI